MWAVNKNTYVEIIIHSLPYVVFRFAELVQSLRNYRLKLINVCAVFIKLLLIV